MSDEQKALTAEVANLDPSRDARSVVAPDRGRTVVLASMAGLIVLSGVLIARAPRPVEAPPAVAIAVPSASNVVTSAVLATESNVDAGVPHEKPVTPRPPPAFRVASLKSSSVEVLEGTFGKHSLAGVLGQHGVSKSETRKVVRAFDGIHRADRPTSKDAYVLVRDRTKGDVLGFEVVASPADVWQVRFDDGPNNGAKKLDIFVEHKRIGVAIPVTADLAKAIAASGLREEARERIDDALEGHVDPDAIRPGVRLRVLADEEWVDGTFVKLRVEALEFVPKTGTPIRTYFYERPSWVADAARRKVHVTNFWDAKGRQPYRGTFRSPLPLARVSSRFNPKRMHPVLHVVMPHNGVDFRASTGTPVFASAVGTVSNVGDGGRCGNMIQIEHANGLSTAYCHLSRFAHGLHAGQRVEARQLIGYVGQTGSATGPHLHFGVKRGGVFIDPMALKMDGVRLVPAADRDLFSKRRDELDIALDHVGLPAAAESADDKEDKDDKDEPAGEE